MPTVSDQLTRVVQKTTSLIDLCIVLQEENDLLKLENQSLNVALETSKNKVKEMEEKVKALTVARSLEGMTENVQAINKKNLGIKQKIDEFIQEIDKSILLLK